MKLVVVYKKAQGNLALKRLKSTCLLQMKINPTYVK